MWETKEQSCKEQEPIDTKGMINSRNGCIIEQTYEAYSGETHSVIFLEKGAEAIEDNGS
jgi:hypothetical protein